VGRGRGGGGVRQGELVGCSGRCGGARAVGKGAGRYSAVLRFLVPGRRLGKAVSHAVCGWK